MKTIKEEKFQFYENLIQKHLPPFKTQELYEECLLYCLTYLKENIIYYYDYDKPIEPLITEIFKRGMVKFIEKKDRKNEDNLQV